MKARFLLPNRAAAILKQFAVLAGTLLLALAPIQAKSDCKPEIRYSIYYNHPAYKQGFDDGYDGIEHNNTFTYYDDTCLYDIGFEDGEEAYFVDNINRKRWKCRF